MIVLSRFLFAAPQKHLPKPMEPRVKIRDYQYLPPMAASNVKSEIPICLSAYMNKLKNIKSLLSQVHTIGEAYRVVEKNTGENFNLFWILGMETAEVKTHSRFLAEMLDPKGSHAQGGKFLELFVEYANSIKGDMGDSPFFLDSKIELNVENSKVKIEKYIGRKTDEEGGRIDICITDGQTLICIENKIYAREQDKQMLRYDNFAKGYRERHLFFLTLWGNESHTVGEKGKAYAISYKKHIIQWLELCKKEAVDLPILRETIGQYINLIKKLTHQTTNKKMEEDIQGLILRNSKEASIISNNYNKAILSISNQIIQSVKRKIEERIRVEEEWEICNFDEVISEKNRGLIWVKPKEFNKDWVIGIEDFNPLFRNTNFHKRIFIGVRAEDSRRNYFELINDDLKEQNYGGWNDYKLISDFNDLEVSLDNPDLLSKISDDRYLEEFVEHLTGEFIEYFNKHKIGIVSMLEHQKRLSSE